MRKPPYRCLFCLKTDGPFLRVEHPIPESLGNDEVLLPPGFVCDPCNQYFGSKLEQVVLAAPPFCLERVSAAVKTKKGKYANLVQPDLHLYATGCWGHLLFAATPQWVNASVRGETAYLFADEPQHYGQLMARFLLKVGLELLALAERDDPFDRAYDIARSYARFGRRDMRWQVGYGLYPRRTDLLMGTRCDDMGLIEIHQLYEWQLGVMPSSDRVFWFAYVNHCFACNLSRPSLAEYLEGFNARNQFTMRLIA